MSNSKKIASIAFTGAAATAATMMGVAPALAGSAFTIKAGGVKITPPTTVKGKIKAGTSATLTDHTKNTTLKCKKGTTSGILSKASGTTTTKIGVVKKTSWSSCTGPFGLTFKAHLAKSLNLVLSKITATGASGYLSGPISGKISGTGLNFCKATISAAAGTHISAKYNNANHSLNIDPAGVNNLHIKSATNCVNAISTSDIANFKAIYTISVPAGLTIS